MLGHLPVIGSAHDLANSFDHMAEATGPAHRLAAGKLASIGVDGEFSLVSCIHRVEEWANLALLADSGVFEAHGLKNRVSIVKFSELNVLGAVTRHFQCFSC